MNKYVVICFFVLLILYTYTVMQPSRCSLPPRPHHHHHMPHTVIKKYDSYYDDYPASQYEILERNW